MSYGKRDEDADQAIVKVDRTAVFQEGLRNPLNVNKLELISIAKHGSSIPPQYRRDDVGHC